MSQFWRKINKFNEMKKLSKIHSLWGKSFVLKISLSRCSLKSGFNVPTYNLKGFIQEFLSLSCKTHILEYIQHFFFSFFPISVSRFLIFLMVIYPYGFFNSPSNFEGVWCLLFMHFFIEVCQECFLSFSKVSSSISG